MLLQAMEVQGEEVPGTSVEPESESLVEAVPTKGKGKGKGRGKKNQASVVGKKNYLLKMLFKLPFHNQVLP